MLKILPVTNAVTFYACAVVMTKNSPSQSGKLNILAAVHGLAQTLYYAEKPASDKCCNVLCLCSSDDKK